MSVTKSHSAWNPLRHSWFLTIDDRIRAIMRRYGIRALRVSLGLVFVWFGALKLLGVSPVERLVAETVYWLPREHVVLLLGASELAIGLGLLLG